MRWEDSEKKSGNQKAALDLGLLSGWPGPSDETVWNGPNY
jgi:hypothetical protein